MSIQLGELTGTAEVTLSSGETLQVSWAAQTDVGNFRESNQDSTLSAPPLFVVADGMGGHAAGDLASQYVVEELAKLAGSEPSSLDAIKEALMAAEERVDQLALQQRVGVGTTVTGAALVEYQQKPHWLVFNIGDSRVYLFSGETFQQITTDHSMVQELLDAGMISDEEAENHPESNVITRAIGFFAEPIPDVWLIPVEEDCRLLICSDGLTKELSDAEIALWLTKCQTLEESAAALVDIALAKGGRDNVSIVLVGLGPDEKHEPASVWAEPETLG